MHPIRASVEDLLCARRSFQARQVVRRTGYSRQLVNRHLRRMVMMGELTVRGERRGVYYEAGPGFPWRPHGVARGADLRNLWDRMAAKYTGFAYVRLGSLGRRMHTRAQAQAACDGLGDKDFLVIDFANVDSASEVFAHELFVENVHRYNHPPMPINMSPGVEVVVERMRRFEQRRARECAHLLHDPLDGSVVGSLLPAADEGAPEEDWETGEEDETRSSPVDAPRPTGEGARRMADTLKVKTLIIGAGISGLATAAFLRERDADPGSLLVLEAEAEPGGYCRTIRRDGFTWDYSGHFFHFKEPALEGWLRERMGGQRVRTVQKRSLIRFGDGFVDFPFQKNIHQLPKSDFIECLYDLYFATERAKEEKGAPPSSFLQMLHARFGRGICEKFLVPYNEKLYACDLDTLDKDAMGRFFPHANLTEIIRNMREPDNASYNSAFTYPEGGAVQYVNALLSEVPREAVSLDEPAVALDLEARTVRTPRRELRYERLVSTMPFPKLLALSGTPHQGEDFSWNKVLVFNLGFDRKGPRDVHWIYYPDRACSFYRVGFYDNIFDDDRLSLYVELGYPKDATPDAEAMLPRVLEDLRKQGVIDGTHRLVASHSVVMDPAYVHVTQRSLAEQARLSSELRARAVHSIGRYGRWTYCSIEDNMLEAYALARELGAGELSARAPALARGGR